MRSFLQILLLTLLVFSTALGATALAREVVLHVPEDAPAGTTVAHLGELLELQSDEHVQLIDRHNGRFRIAEDRRLIVGPRGLDHETGAEHRLDVRIISGPPGEASTKDPLQNKFEELADTQLQAGKAGARSAEVGADHRSDEDPSTARPAALRVFVDNVAEAPLLLGSRFGVPGSSSPLPEQRIGRALVVDLDSNEQHRFELLEGAAWIRIDPVTGELFLRDEVNPLAIAALQVRVRVTDRAGLSAEASYPVRLNDCPPAPPLPALLADTDPRVPDPVDDAETSVPPAPADVAEAQVADQHVTRAASPAPIAAEAPAAAVHAAHHLPRIAVESTAARWVSRIRQFLSQAGAGLLGDHPHGWLITLAVVMCVAVIVVSGVRNAIQAGRVGMEMAPSTPSASVPSRSQAAGTPILRSPSEIADILARLDTVIGKVDIAAAQAELAQSTDVQEATPEPLEHQLETAATLPQSPEGAKLHPHGAEASVSSVAPAVRYFPVEQAGATEAGPLRGAGQQRPAAASGMTLDERERMEQFRRISRMMNRADIGRHNRVRLRYEWMSIGMTSLVCVVTGTVCVFTSCFGAMSVPLGSVMFSVAAVLLMRPDLYEDFSSEEETDWGRGEPQ